MFKTTKSAALGLVGGVLIASAAQAAPTMLSDAALDSVVAAGMERVNAFVCPVISTENVLHAKNGISINGAYSVLGPDVMVPVHATNDNGAGSPGGDFARPGDTSYTAIWAN